MIILIVILLVLIGFGYIGYRYQQKLSFTFSLESYKCRRFIGTGLLVFDWLDPKIHFEKYKVKIYQLYGRHTFKERYRLFVSERICVVYLTLLITTVLTILVILKESPMDNLVKRPEFEQGSQYMIYEYHLEDEDQFYEGNLGIMIPSRLPNKSESYNYLENTIVEIEKLLSQNELGFYETYSDLNTPEIYKQVTIDWNSDSQYLMSNGRVRSEVIREPIWVQITGVYHFNHISMRKKYRIKIHPLPMTVSEEYLEEVLGNAVVDSTSKSDYVILPDMVDGHLVQWATADNWLDGKALFVIGIMIAALFYYLKAKALDEYMTKRSDEIQLRLPNLINKIALLIQAGMTFTVAWNKVVTDYRKMKDTSGIKYELYEEMLITMNDIAKGTPELVAYELFARKTGCKEVYRFITIVTQNIKKGNHMLSAGLMEFSYEIWQQREVRAKIKGEKASTKMILPTIIVLITLMMMILTPAFLQLQI